MLSQPLALNRREGTNLQYNKPVGGDRISTLIAYVSYSGNTAAAARFLSQTLRSRGVKAREIELVTAGRLTFPGGVLRATLGLGAVLSLPEDNMDGYNTIFVATPVWSFSSLPQVNSFLCKMSLGGKNVYTLTTCHLWPGRANWQLRSRINRRGGSLKGSLNLCLPAGFNEDARLQVVSWLNSLDLELREGKTTCES